MPLKRPRCLARFRGIPPLAYRAQRTDVCTDTGAKISNKYVSSPVLLMLAAGVCVDRYVPRENGIVPVFGPSERWLLASLVISLLLLFNVPKRFVGVFFFFLEGVLVSSSDFFPQVIWNAYHVEYFVYSLITRITNLLIHNTYTLVYSKSLSFSLFLSIRLSSFIVFLVRLSYIFVYYMW